MRITVTIHSGQVVRNVPLLSEKEKKYLSIHFIHGIYQIHGILSTKYMVYYKPYTWYIINPIHGILYTLLKIGIKNWPKIKTD
jgi:hypothetical protein